MNLLAWFFRLALHLYPPGFRREYAEEMQAVFMEALENSGNHGQFSSARIFLREFSDLPANLFRQFWNDFYAWIQLPWQEQASLSANIALPGSWLSASLAGFPHLLYALALYLPLLVTNLLAIPDYHGPGLPMFWAMVAVLLLIAHRLDWPGWSASWIGYGLVFLLSQITSLSLNKPLSFLVVLVWLTLAVVLLFWLARRAWISGLLAILPISPMWIWLSQRANLLGSLEEAALYVSASLMLLLAVIAIVRLGRWQSALLLILSVILATGTPGSYSAGEYTIVNEPYINYWNSTGNWIINYLFMLVLTAPLWLMVLAKHIFTSLQTQHQQQDG